MEGLIEVRNNRKTAKASQLKVPIKELKLLKPSEASPKAKKNRLDRRKKGSHANQSTSSKCEQQRAEQA